MWQEIDDTGGRRHHYVFAAAGAGLELVLPYGFSLSTDLQVGPEHRSTDENIRDETWLFSARFRLGLGYRL